MSRRCRRQRRTGSRAFRQLVECQAERIGAVGEIATQADVDDIGALGDRPLHPGDYPRLQTKAELVEHLPVEQRRPGRHPGVGAIRSGPLPATIEATWVPCPNRSVAVSDSVKFSSPTTRPARSGWVASMPLSSTATVTPDPSNPPPGPHRRQSGARSHPARPLLGGPARSGRPRPVGRLRVGSPPGRPARPSSGACAVSGERRLRRWSETAHRAQRRNLDPLALAIGQDRR